MNPITVDDIRALLPDVNELRPLLDRLLVMARPDAERRWAGSGELGTVGERLVDPDRMREAVPDVLAALTEHLSRVYSFSAQAVAALAENDPESALGALLEAAGAERDSGRLPEAEAFVRAALRLTHRLTDGRAAVPVLLAGARTARSLGDWEGAEARYLQALKIAADAGDADHAATAAIGSGNLAVDRGLWSLAEERYDEADTWVDRLPKGSPQAWHLPLNRSIVRREQGRLDEAEAFLDEADRRAEGEEENDQAAAILMNARGQLLVARARLEGAEVAFRHALARAEDPDARVTIGVNLAQALLSLGRTLAAGEEARRAEELALTAGVVLRLPEVYRVLGEIASARDHPDAFVFFERALTVVRERGLPEFERARTLEVYGLDELGRSEPEAGAAHLREAATIYETLGCRAALERIRSLLETEASEEPPEG